MDLEIEEKRQTAIEQVCDPNYIELYCMITVKLIETDLFCPNEVFYQRSHSAFPLGSPGHPEKLPEYVVFLTFSSLYLIQATHVYIMFFCLHTDCMSTMVEEEPEKNTGLCDFCVGLKYFYSYSVPRLMRAFSFLVVQWLARRPFRCP